MDSNNMYQNQQTTGTEPENNQSVNSNGYQNDYNQGGNNQGGNNQGVYSQNAYQNNYNQNNYNGNYQQYPYQNYNGNYQMPYQQPSQLDLEEPVKMGEWLLSFLIMVIPCVGIVMMFVWAFSQTEKKSKSNFFKACLIVYAIAFVIGISAGVVEGLAGL